MALTDGDVAVLARQAVDLLDPGADISIEPADPVDPYRWNAQAWLVWPLLGGRRAFGVYLDSGMSRADASERLRTEIAHHRPDIA